MVFGLFGDDDPAGDLEDVREAETVADVLDAEHLDRLPPGWTARPEVVQFGDRPLSEVVVVAADARRPEYVLAPADTYDPTGETELLVRAGGRRRSLATVGSLTAAFDAVAERIDVATDAPPAPDRRAARRSGGT